MLSRSFAALLVLASLAVASAQQSGAPLSATLRGPGESAATSSANQASAPSPLPTFTTRTSTGVSSTPNVSTSTAANSSNRGGSSSTANSGPNIGPSPTVSIKPKAPFPTDSDNTAGRSPITEAGKIGLVAGVIGLLVVL